MKIVIDIPEKALDVLKNDGVDWLGAEHILDAVSKGIPYEEKPKGEWIKGPEISRTMIGDNVLSIDYKDYTCSNCGLVLDRLLYHVDGSPFYKFCPECGTDMRGGQK